MRILTLISAVGFLLGLLMILLGTHKVAIRGAELILLVSSLVALFMVLLGTYKIAIGGEKVAIGDFLHIPLNSNDVIHIKGVHNIIDGIGLIALVIGAYLLFFHGPSWSWTHWNLDTRSWRFFKTK